MEMSQRLTDLRGSIPGCHVAAFIDLSTQMVLAVDARSKQPQERLDLLADRAKALFSTPGVTISDTIGEEQIFDQVVVCSEDNTEAFVRTNADTTEAIGLVCSRSANIDMALRRCQAMLADIGASE